MLVIMCAHCIPVNYLKIHTSYYKHNINPVPITHYMKNLGKAPCINFQSRSGSGRLKPFKKKLSTTCMSEIISFEKWSWLNNEYYGRMGRDAV
jgi:hypothetical protein